MLKRLRKYYINKPNQACLMLLILVWSTYDITSLNLADKTALTKEFLHSRYVIVWPMVDKKVKLYHYKEEWTTPALDGLMHLDYKKIKITGYPSKYGNQVFAEYNQTPNNNYDISFPLEGSLSEAYFSTLDAKYYLVSENATIVEQKLGKNIEDLIQEIERVREEFSSVLSRMKIFRLVYLVLRFALLLLCIKWSGDYRKRKIN